MLIQVSVAILIYFLIQHAKAGHRLPKIRRLAGLDAIDEAIGRATEMGRPVIFANGSNGLDDAQTIASFPVLSYVAHTCARYDTKPVSYTHLTLPTIYSV